MLEVYLQELDFTAVLELKFTKKYALRFQIVELDSTADLELLLPKNMRFCLLKLNIAAYLELS